MTEKVDATTTETITESRVPGLGEPRHPVLSARGGEALRWAHQLTGEAIMLCPVEKSGQC